MAIYQHELLRQLPKLNCKGQKHIEQHGDGRAMRDLRKAGLLETEQRYREKGGKSSLLYKIRRQ